MGYGREWRRGLVCGLVAGVVAGWIWTTIGGWVVATEAKHWWDIATAFGTVGAAVAAVCVPIWQNWIRRREKEQAEVLEEWAVVQDAIRLIGSLRELVIRWAASGEVPPASHFRTLNNDLSVVRSRTINHFGGLIVADVMKAASDIENAAAQSEKSPSTLMQGLDGRYMLMDVDAYLKSRYSQALVWMDSVRSRFQGLKMPMPAKDETSNYDLST